MAEPVIIATWPFGMTAAKKGLSLLEAGNAALDAALAGAQAVEDDPAVNSVGYGGLANAIGIVQLDACVMDGKTLACGGVAGVENVRHVAALARRVMEMTRHVLVIGNGIGMAVIAAFILGVAKIDRWTYIAWALVFAGGIGNLIDRMRINAVIDFLNLGIGPVRTGIFNVADMAITAGFVMLLPSIFRSPAEDTPAPASVESTPAPAPASGSPP